MGMSGDVSLLYNVLIYNTIENELQRLRTGRKQSGMVLQKNMFTWSIWGKWAATFLTIWATIVQDGGRLQMPKPNISLGSGISSSSCVLTFSLDCSFGLCATPPSSKPLVDSISSLRCCPSNSLCGCNTDSCTLGRDGGKSAAVEGFGVRVWWEGSKGVVASDEDETGGKSVGGTVEFAG